MTAMPAAVEFTVSVRNPLVSGHTVGGRPLLPGMSYLDILLQAMGRNGHPCGEVEVRDLTIEAPLVGRDAGVVVRVETRQASPGVWQATVCGTSTDSADPAPDAAVPVGPVVYARAELHLGRPTFDERLDPSSRSGANRVTDIDVGYQLCRRVGLIHSGAMRARGQAYRLEDAMLLDVALAPQARSDAGQFLVHPALLDACVIGAALADDASQQVADGSANGPGLYLPLSMASFRTVGPLTGACTARIAMASRRSRNELRYLTMDLFDAGGAKIAELRDLASKRVGEPDPPDVAAAGMPRAADRDRFATILRELVAARLGYPCDRIDAHIGYHELGLDSAGMLDVVRLLRVRLGASLSPTLLFEYPTVDALARELARRGAGQPEPPAAMSGSAPTPAPAPALPTAPAAGSGSRPGNAAGPGPLDIAVVGLAGRYPQAYDVAAFWRNLRDARDCVTSVPPQRWDWRAYGGTGRWGGFIDGVDRFDPLFFNISPREAAAMDPLERLFLEHCWIALEDAGYTPHGLRGTAEEPGRVGVYAGVMFPEYTLLAAEALVRGRRLGTSGGGAAIANRVSYFCDFSGPSMTVDTACSGSLTALFLACRALRDGDVDAALAGGVNLSLHPNKYLTLGEANFLSSDGRCAAFGDGGDGYVPAEGVGVLVLKRRTDAERDGDHVYGVVRGVAINHGGRSSGFTVPNPQAQRRVVEQALAQAGVEPGTVGYVEAHGTGTGLGDPIEIAALAQAFRATGGDGTDGQFCAIGSVKSNIGHSEAVAGIAGLTKVLLQFAHRQLAPSLHARTPNPAIDFAATPFRVNHELAPWQRPRMDGRELPRRAGISSFGAGGSNAHVVVEEYLPAPRPTAAPGRVLVVLSARSEQELRAYAQAYVDLLGDSLTSRTGGARDVPESPMAAQIGYTTQVGREAYDERLALVVTDLAQLADQLVGFLESGTSAHAYRGSVRSAEASRCRRMVEGASGSEFLGAVTRGGELDQLAELWACGVQVDWALLYPQGHPTRVSLPTYPFTRQRCWITDEPAPDGSAAGDDTVPGESAPRGDTAPGESTPSGGAAPLVSGAEPVGTVQSLVTAAWEEVLGVDGVAPDAVFGDLGGDSITAGRVIARLNASFPFELELRGLLAARTVAEMARAVETELIERIDELPDETVRSLVSF